MMMMQRTSTVVASSRSSVLPVPSVARCVPASISSVRAPVSAASRPAFACRATAADQDVSVASTAPSATPAPSDNWIPVCLPEELPKGVRKEVDVDGRPVLLFWYRNQIYAIEGRSPAEGAYSEGFISAKFTQDGCIICPATGTTFSIADGSIKEWMPTNPVMRVLTPQSTCRKMDVFPVKLTQQAILVDVSKSSLVATRSDRGGAGTSLENNNVFTVQPNVYFEGMDPTVEQASVYQDGPKIANPAVAATTVLAAGAVTAVATAIIIYISQ